MICLWTNYMKKNMKNIFFLASLQYRKESDPDLDPDPEPDPLVRGTDPHQNVIDPQHC
jgi:hypothetical protein